MLGGAGCAVDVVAGLDFSLVVTMLLRDHGLLVVLALRGLEAMALDSRVGGYQ